jgi:dienelactone hydrolase
MSRFSVCWAGAVICAAAQAFAQSALPWDRAELFKAPQVFDAPEYATNDVKAVFFEGEPYQGKPTRVFAYYGVPKHAAGTRVPGMVLVHGGGGSAFVRWVRLWNSRGYAAISMDTCGAVSGNAYGNEQTGHVRHAWAGPAGWGGFDKADDPVKDQWTYHAVAAAVRGHSLLRSLPGVDGARIGLTGISWGGYLTCIVAGVDDRFAFAVPVYGCGFLGDNSTWLDAFKKMGDERAKRWLSLWDPSVYLPLAKMPFLWVDGSNDFAYPMDSLQKSYRALKAPYALCVRLRMPHGHGAAGENPKEIEAFADHVAKGAPALPEITELRREGRQVTVRFNPNQRVVAGAELNYTADGGSWMKRRWEAQTIEANACSGEVKASVPTNAVVYYVNLFTDDGLAVSTAHEEL